MSDAYLAVQLDRIIAEETMPSIGAGIVLPEPRFPEFAPQPFRFVTAARGVERFGESTPVTKATHFIIGSIAKPLTGLMVARVIAREAQTSAPALR